MSVKEDTVEDLSTHIRKDFLSAPLQAIKVDGKVVHLRNKFWQVLNYLIDNQDKLVTRETLITNYWNGNMLTGEQGVTHTIYHLRKLIKEHGLKIVTIPKTGYVLQQENIPLRDTLLASAQRNAESSERKVLKQEFNITDEKWG